jgi:predicted 2-oxoglutarate/Fe(II)-dependent dioxygenase YbiX
MIHTLAEGEIWTLPGVLTPDECRAVIATGEAAGFEAAAVRTSGGPQMMEGVRNNDRIVFDDPALARLLWERVREHVPPEVEGARASGLYQPFRLYRYDPGQRFKRHKDGSEMTDTGERSRFTFLVYLNADCEGGETVFSDYTFENGQGTRHEITATPEAGMGLVFKHERWHEGAPVIVGRKYVLRTDVLYRNPSP